MFSIIPDSETILVWITHAKIDTIRMRLIIIFCTLLYCVICSPELSMTALYPELLQVDELLFGVRITQILSSAYIDLYLSTHDIDGYTVHPMGRVGVFYFSEIKNNLISGPTDSYWMMVLLPAKMDVAPFDEWLEATGFSSNSQEEYNSWLSERTEEDDFTALFISAEPGQGQGDLKRHVKSGKPHFKPLI